MSRDKTESHKRIVKAAKREFLRIFEAHSGKGRNTGWRII